MFHRLRTSHQKQYQIKYHGSLFTDYMRYLQYYVTLLGVKVSIHVQVISYFCTAHC
jgi:hypothetical protein